MQDDGLDDASYSSADPGMCGILDVTCLPPAD